jgi:hypothetical protein
MEYTMMHYFKTYEAHQAGYFKWQDLDMETRSDIISNIYDSDETGYLNSWNVNTMREWVDNYDFSLEIIYLSVDEMAVQAEETHTQSQRVVDDLIFKLSHLSDLDPIIVVNRKFMDGGHRVKAYKQADREKIPAIDIACLLETNWQEFFENDGEISCAI